MFSTGNPELDELLAFILFLTLFGSVAVFIINRMFPESFGKPEDKI